MRVRKTGAMRMRIAGVIRIKRKTVIMTIVIIEDASDKIKIVQMPIVKMRAQVMRCRRYIC